MDDKRKKIVVKEILFWKQNNMLPEHYCNFLLALYSEGEETTPNKNHIGKEKRHLSKWWLLSILLLPISLFVIYFTELSIVLQTAILAIFVVSLFFSGIYYSRKSYSVSILYVIAALLLLIFSIFISEEFLPNNTMYTYLVLGLNCFLWIVIGMKLKLIYFTTSGILGLIVIVFFILI